MKPIHDRLFGRHYRLPANKFKPVKQVIADSLMRDIVLDIIIFGILAAIIVGGGALLWLLIT